MRFGAQPKVWLLCCMQVQHTQTLARSLKRTPCLSCLQFLSLDLRNGSLRKKYDALKYTLKKMEVSAPTHTFAACRRATAWECGAGLQGRHGRRFAVRAPHCQLLAPCA